jgi:AraC-like DNA-binding protein
MTYAPAGAPRIASVWRRASNAVDARAPHRATNDPRVREVAELVLEGAATRIGALARRVGVTERHLARLFHDEVGFSPKRLASVARLTRAARVAWRRTHTRYRHWRRAPPRGRCEARSAGPRGRRRHLAPRRPVEKLARASATERGDRGGDRPRRGRNGGCAGAAIRGGVVRRRGLDAVSSQHRRAPRRSASRNRARRTARRFAPGIGSRRYQGVADFLAGAGFSVTHGPLEWGTFPFQRVVVARKPG